MKLIIHAGTGTVIDADDDVFIIDTNLIHDDVLGPFLEDGDEEEIVEIAKENGRRINSEQLEMTYRNCVAFTPTALRYEVAENSGVTRRLDRETIEWAATTSAQNLDYVAELIMNDEILWERYTEIVAEAISAAHTKTKGKSK
jgi:uroporphyrinogen-III synthase